MSGLLIPAIWLVACVLLTVAFARWMKWLSDQDRPHSRPHG
jgi:hypothetical protein